MRYKLLGRSGLRVSEFCLGAMTFGTEWHIGADRETSKAVFDAYADAGGNFIDTANIYSCGTSERLVGEFTAADRDHFVIATKYTISDREGDPSFSGNHRKNLMRSVRDSLARLKTDHIDLFWVHCWDSTTPVEEVMRGLDDLVSRGLVHHVGISDTPAWVVAQANTIADFRGWSPFVAVQGEYSLLKRDAERDLLPMARSLGLAFTPWGALGGGVLTGKYLRGETGRVDPAHERLGPRANAIAAETVAIAAELAVPPGHVALAWTRQRGQQIIPLIGSRRPEQITEALGAATLVLGPAHLEQLDQVSAIAPGFPHDFLSGDHFSRLLGHTVSRIDPRGV
jgi:aryl-alcohol dehydrogenase-like predicted oxidoreductase